jgi:hypothetical protein
MLQRSGAEAEGFPRDRDTPAAAEQFAASRCLFKREKGFVASAKATFPSSKSQATANAPEGRLSLSRDAPLASASLINCLIASGLEAVLREFEGVCRGRSFEEQEALEGGYDARADAMFARCLGWRRRMWRAGGEDIFDCRA